MYGCPGAKPTISTRCALFTWRATISAAGSFSAWESSFRSVPNASS